MTKPNIQWEKWFEIGHETIDFEHQVFFSLIRKLQRITEEKQTREDIIRTMEEIIKYADFHFLSEENIMIEYDYPGYEEHKALHRQIMIRLREDISCYEGGIENAEKIVAFLVEWLITHTITEDLKIAKLEKERKLQTLFQ